jgi:hypothetical protein
VAVAETVNVTAAIHTVLPGKSRPVQPRFN